MTKHKKQRVRGARHTLLEMCAIITGVSLARQYSIIVSRTVSRKAPTIRALNS